MFKLLHTLILYNYNNIKIINNLPNNIQNLILYGVDRINNLSKNIIKVKFNNNSAFDEKINNLPHSIKTLELLGSVFNHPINNLPKSLLTLKFGNNFNQSLIKLPLSLQKLYLDNIFNQSLDFLPQGLKIINIKNNNFINCVDDLPSSIEQIIINNNQLCIVNNIYHNKVIIQNVYNGFDSDTDSYLSIDNDLENVLNNDDYYDDDDSYYFYTN